MGEVYRARDTRLDRDVAIKVLSDHFVSSPSLKERFEREARTISPLSHPNICKPQLLFSTQPVGPGLFEATLDGNRFVMIQAPVQNSSNLTRVVNWLEGVKK